MKLYYMRGFGQLAWANWRELIRNWQMIVYMFIPPLLMMAMFPLMTFLTEDGVVTLVVPMQAEPAVLQTVETLQQMPQIDVEVATPAQGGEMLASGEYRALVFMPESLDYGTIRIETPADSDVMVVAVQSALEKATRKAGSPTVVVDRPQSFYSDPVRYGTVGSLVYALGSIAIFGIAMPIVSMRTRGILRLISTTPVSRLTYVLAQIPSRLVLGAGLTVATLVFIHARWDVPLWNLVQAFGTAMLGFWMLGAVGYLLGGAFESAEGPFVVVSPLLTLGAIAGGVLFPLNGFPDWVQTLPPFIPLSYFADALRQQLGVGGRAMGPLWVDYLVMVGSTILFTVLAIRFFRWDYGEPAYTGSEVSRVSGSSNKVSISSKSD